MSYYFCIVNTRDQPTFELEFGTSKQGGDGIARFSQEARELNPFLMHASLDYVDDMQWYLRRIDHFAHTHISAFLTPTSTRFLLLHLPHPPNTAPLPPPQTSTSYSPYGPYTNAFPGTSFTPSSSSTTTTTTTSTSARTGLGGAGGGGGGIPNNPTSPQTEEAVRLFFTEVFEIWLKGVMSPFGGPGEMVSSSVFRARVVAAGRKYL
ncbi:MAG: hypothetical protein L6R40_000135 [Gallowayella cf. fulva]|nr:MAG: hypothetical protein L6R40_000135 [Xanthomendoza cf. fulva]